MLYVFFGCLASFNLSAQLTTATGADPATLRIRLVQVRETPQNEIEIDRNLRDLLPILQRNLRYQSYQMAGQSDLPVRTGSQTNIGAGFLVSIDAVEGTLTTISIHHQASGRPQQEPRRLLQTGLRLQQGRPVIVGPFREHRGNEYIVVLSL